MQRYDLFVIGTGSAATTVASKCRADGWSVAIADVGPFGGTCALRGCDPKKVLVGASAVQDAAAHYADGGILSQATRIDWGELQKFKRTFTEPMSEQIESWLTSEGITAYHDAVRFIGPNTLEIGDETVEAKQILIATGAAPAPLNIQGEKLLTTSDEFLMWERLPKRVVFVGGGYISFEFAHVAKRAGANVTVLQRGWKPLKNFDEDLVSRLSDYSSQIGIDFRMNTEVTKIHREKGELVVQARREGQSVRIRADAVVHGGGRIANLDSLNLDAAEVQYASRGVKVNEYLQSVSNPHVYAAGDAADTDGPPLTPVAAMEGHVAAHNLRNTDKRTADYHGIPTVTFTTPPLASVGLTEAQTREQGIPVKVNRQDTSSWYTARQQLAPVAGFCVIVNEDTDEIVGAHVLGPHAEEIINILSLAIREHIPASALRQHPFAYPTASSDFAHML